MSPFEKNGAPQEVIYDPYLATPPVSHAPASAARKTQSSQPEGRQRITLIVAISALVTAMVAVAVLVYGAYHWRGLLDRGPAAASEEEEGTKRAALPADDDDGDDEKASASDTPSRDDVLQDTETMLRGSIEVVDVGVTSGALIDVLRTHYAIADAKGQKLLVMTTGRRCSPCRGVDDALSHELMQKALHNVRLVRVDLEVFGEELKELRMPTRKYPAFFLLGADIRPFDAIHGGEWGEDIAENIAPVLGPFVRGELKERAHPEWSPTTTSVPL